MVGSTSGSRRPGFKWHWRSTPVYHGPVEALNADLLAEASNGETLKEIDLLAGGPPCPPYSKSRFYRKEKPRALEDPLGWATLHGYLSALQTLKPKAFLLENVAGSAYANIRTLVGLIPPDDIDDPLVEAATREGYTCAFKVLNAADYGAPQIRERLFLVGLRGKTFDFPDPTHREKSEGRLFDEELPLWRTAGEATSSPR